MDFRSSPRECANSGRKVFVHEKALCESEKIGPGTRIWAFAHVMKDAMIGAGCNICDHVFVESGAIVGNYVTVKNGVYIWDGVLIEDNVFLGPNVMFTNVKTPRVGFKKERESFIKTKVCAGATLGASTTIVCGVTIGKQALVGAGTVVTRDVPNFAVVLGNPARQVGWACLCGERLAPSLICRCGRSYEMTTLNGLQQIQGPHQRHEVE